MKWQNITPKDLYVIINKLSLTKSNAKRSPHPIYFYWIDGKKELSIKLPNSHGGSGSLSTGFIDSIRKKMRLDNDQFIDLVKCPLSAEEYQKILKAKLDRQ